LTVLDAKLGAYTTKAWLIRLY